MTAISGDIWLANSQSMSTNSSNLRTINMLGLPVLAENRAVWQTWLQSTLNSSARGSEEPKLVFTPNAEQLVQAYESSTFLQDLHQADLLLPDGMGPLLVSYWLDRHHPIAERLAGADVVMDVLALAAREELQVLVVGGREYGVINQLGYATLHIPLNASQTLKVAWLPGYVDISHPSPTEHATVRSVINHLRPAIVLVAFGAPWQEAWAVRQKELLGSVNTQLVMVIGGTMDFLLGKVSRAPKFMRQAGLEWLYRLILQPWRAVRQLRLVKFVWLLLSGLLVKPPGTAAAVQSPQNWRD